MSRKRALNDPSYRTLPSPSSSSSLSSSWTQLDWQYPGKDVMEKITRRLETPMEIRYLRAVCPGWRDSIPLPPKYHLDADGSPLKLPYPIVSKGKQSSIRGYYLLKDRTIYCLEPLKENSTDNWFVNIEEKDSGKVCLKDPFNRFRNLGQIDSLHEKVINLWDYKVREVGKTYYLEFVEVGDNQCFWIRKVVVGRNNKGEFWVMANIRGRKLGFWKIGFENWAEIDDGRAKSHYVDIAFHNGRIYAVDWTGLTVAIDPSSLRVTQVASDFHPYRPFCRYLVSSLGDLFLVDIPCQTPYLKVHKLNEEIGKWIPVKRLGYRAMLVGDDCCYALSTKDFAGFKRNSVYFSDAIFDHGQYRFPGCCVGFMRLDKKDFGYPKSKIFWPPPTWLGQTPSCK